MRETRSKNTFSVLLLFEYEYSEHAYRYARLQKHGDLTVYTVLLYSVINGNKLKKGGHCSNFTDYSTKIANNSRLKNHTDNSRNYAGTFRGGLLLAQVLGRARRVFNAKTSKKSLRVNQNTIRMPRAQAIILVRIVFWLTRRLFLQCLSDMPKGRALASRAWNFCKAFCGGATPAAACRSNRKQWQC